MTRRQCESPEYSTSSIRATCFGDKGYVGTGIITPFKKPAGGELLDWQREFNADVNSRRYVVERAIANFKVWRVLFTDYRRPLSTYGKCLPQSGRSISIRGILDKPHGSPRLQKATSNSAGGMLPQPLWIRRLLYQSSHSNVASRELDIVDRSPGATLAI